MSPVLSVRKSFFLTIFLAFVGYILFYVGLWLAVALNAFGATIALLDLVVDRESATAKVLNLIGLVVNAVLLAGAIHTLARIHGF